MLDLGTLQIGVKVDDGNAKTQLLGLADSATKAEGRFAKFSGGLKKFAIGAGIVAGAVAGALVGIKKLTDKVAQYGDAVDKNSQKMGISAEAYQKWDYVLQRNGTSINALKTGMKTFTAQIDAGSEAFDKLGVSTKKSDGSFRETEDVLNDSITALAGVEDQTERTALANELFGKRTAQELLPMLNSGADGIEDLQNRAEELGFVMSDEAVKACADYEDAMTDVQMSTMGLRNNIMSGLIPVMANMASTLSEKIGHVSTVIHEEVEKNGAKGILTAIGKLAEEAGNKLAEMAPKILAKMAELATSLGEYMAQAIPNAFSKIADLGSKLADAIGGSGTGELMAKAQEIMTTFFTGLVNAVPKLMGSLAGIITAIADKIGSGDSSGMISAGLTMMKNLVVGIVKALPQLLLAVGKLVIALVKAIVTHIPDLLKAGLDIVVAIGKGIINGIKNLFSIGQNINDTVKEGITSKISDFLNAGKEIVSNIISGIKDKVSGAVETIKGIFTGIGDAIGSFISEHPALQGAIEKVGSVFGKFAKPLGVAQTAMEKVKGAWDNVLKQKAKKKFSAIQSKIKDTASKAKNLYNRWQEVLGQTASKTFSAIKKGFSAFVDGAKKVYNRWQDVLGQAASKTFSVVKNGFESFIEAVKRVKEWWSNLHGGTKTFNVNKNETTTHGKRVGIREVPYDGYPAELHKGETVLTATEANQYKKWLNRKPEADTEVKKQVQTIEKGNSYNIYIDGARINDDAQIENMFGNLMFEMARRGLM